MLPLLIQFDSPEIDIPMICAAAGCYDPPTRAPIEHVLTRAECERYLRQVNDPPKAPHRATPYRQKWYNYYGRNHMITCEVEIGGWSYGHIVHYYRWKLP